MFILLLFFSLKTANFDILIIYIPPSVLVFNFYLNWTDV